jgi:hypothetical protein
MNDSVMFQSLSGIFHRVAVEDIQGAICHDDDSMVVVYTAGDCDVFRAVSCVPAYRAELELIALRSA